MMTRFRKFVYFAAACLPSLAAQTKPADPPNLYGVYQMIDNGVATRGGHRNEGSLAALPLLPAAAEQAKKTDLKQDPAKMCQPIGPFRMMARARNKIEIMPENGMIVILFEDVSRGLLRTIGLNRGHAKDAEEAWQGDSVGRWEGNTLVVDSTNFNDRTWLNENGAQHSNAFHLTERIRPVLSGRYLEYKATAEDPNVLAKPYTYTRYYEKVASEIAEDFCDNEE
jgi:hypothetical protein